MRILIISSYFQPEAVGGLERSAFEAACGLHRAGHHVEVLTCRWRGGIQAEEAPFSVHRLLSSSSPAQYYGHHLRTLPRRFRDAAANATAGRENLALMRDFLKEHSFDILAVWAFSGIGMGLVHAATDEGIPVVWHVGDLNLRERLHPHWVNEVIHRLTDAAWMRVERSVSTQTVLVNSEFTRRMYAERGFPPESLRVIYRGVAGDQVLDVPLPRAVPPYLYMACRITPQKGVEDAIRALALLRAITDSGATELWVAGEGEPAYVDGLKGIARELGVGDAVRFVGSPERSVVLDQMRRASMILSASRYEEYFGRVNIEAMACATPLLAANTENVREIGVDGQDLLTFQQCDPKDLAAKAHRILTDSELSSRLVASATKRVREAFLQDVIDRQIIEVYSQLVGVTAQKTTA